MKKLFIATLALTLTLTAFANEYARLAAHVVEREFRGADKDWLEAEKFRADAVYKYEAAALAKQQRLLLKKQEELIAVQLELSKEQLRATKNANKVVSVYANLLDSLPAITTVAERYMKFQCEDKETSAIMSIWKTVCLLIKRPVTSDDLHPVVDSLLKAEGRIK